VQVVVPSQLAGLGTFPARAGAAADGSVVSIAPAEIAHLSRSGWRAYELRTGDRVLATFRRRGFVPTGYDIEVGDVGLSARVEWALYDPFDVALTELVASTPHPEGRTVRVRQVDDGRGRTWVVSPSPIEGPIQFISHLPWPGRPRVSVMARPVRSGYNTLVVVIGVCAVLAHRSLAFDVPGPSTRRR
jgi:hypothetical protein